MTPSSQKAGARPISFALYDAQAKSFLAGPTNLIIRPEELTHSEPTSANLQRTFGGGWLDDFGPGTSQINISGHTGWRGSASADGVTLFADLRQTVFVGWHNLRAQRRNSGKDPDSIELLFHDELDDISVVVAPMEFRLRRHKQRPLLMQFTIQMLVMRPADAKVEVVDQLTINNPNLMVNSVSDAAIDSINGSAAQLQSLAQTIESAFDPAARVLSGFAKSSSSLLTTVTGLVQSGNSVFDATTAPLVFAAQQVQLAGRNIAQSLIEPLSLSLHERYVMMQLASTFSEAYCNIRNNLPAIERYFDFGGLFGASNCSSTAGGSAPSDWQNANPFLSLYPASATALGSILTQDASSAIADASRDVLSVNQYSSAELLSLVSRISAGISIPSAAALGTGSTATGSSVAAANPFERLQQNLQRVETRRGDTLQRVAARELGDASQWFLIASINGLLAPFITDDPAQASDTVLLTGSSVMIPGAGTGAGITKSAADPTKTYGTGIALTDGFMTASNGKLNLVSGIANLTQALEIRINTDGGELVFHPDFATGIRTQKGQANSPANTGLTAALLRRSIASDPRISSVLSSTASASGDVSRVSVVAMAIDGSKVPIEAAV